MAVQAQEELVLTAPETQNRTPMDLLSLALQKEANIEIIERLAALQERAMAKQAEQSFFRSLHMAQEEAPSVEPNKEVKTSNGKLMYKYAAAHLHQAWDGYRIQWGRRASRESSGTVLRLPSGRPCRALPTRLGD